MDLDALKRMPIAELAAKDCAVFMWATDPMLPQAIELMAARGFPDYRNLMSSYQMLKAL